MRVRSSLVDTHSLKRFHTIRIHGDSALVLDEGVVQILLVREPDFGVHMHRA